MKKFSNEELRLFSWNMGKYLEADSSVTDGLHFYAQACQNRKFSYAVTRIEKKIIEGKHMSDAMKEEGFPDFFVQFIKLGENSGSLDAVFLFFVKEYDKTAAWKDYYGKVLILPSLFLMSITLIAEVIRNSLSLLPFLFGLGFLGFTLLYVSILEHSKRMTLKGNLSTISRIIGTAMTAGLGLLPSFQVAKDAVKNSMLSKPMEKAIDDIEKGSTVSDAMLGFKHLLPVEFKVMISLGEETGTFNQAMLEIAEICEKDIALEKEGYLNCLRILFIVFWTLWSVFAILPIFLT
ncbi:MAG: type II secretion system F family protein [Eubacteriales bacterium]